MIKSYERIDTGKEAYEQEGVKCINTRSDHMTCSVTKRRIKNCLACPILGLLLTERLKGNIL